ncbi:MAG: hypothetical protein KAU94_00920 [Verrucomicrobia bacterium]|nr:hypothetical protein [Verrucomicrobiota bacterium]
MKHPITLISVLVVLVATVPVAVHLVHENTPEAKAPVADGTDPQDRRVLEEVLECPEELDGEIYSGTSPKNTSASPMVATSSGNSPEEYGEAPVPTEGKKPYYWADFASLRKESIRNPDSVQNRAIYRDLDKMHRQQLESNSKPSK